MMMATLHVENGTSAPASSCVVGGLFVAILVFLGSDDDELAPVEDLRRGDEKIC